MKISLLMRCPDWDTDGCEYYRDFGWTKIIPNVGDSIKIDFVEVDGLYKVESRLLKYKDFGENPTCYEAVLLLKRLKSKAHQ